MIKFYTMSDRFYLIKKYKRKFKTTPNLDYPVTFNEKVMYRILHDRNVLFSELADKVKVRGVIAQEFGGKYLTKLLGVYDDVDDIDLSTLPRRFVLKCSHDSNSCVIYNDPSFSYVDWEKGKKKLRRCLSRNMYHSTREKHYCNIPARILCEEYIDVYADKNMDDTPALFRMHCFNGKVSYIEVDFTDSQGNEFVNIYDRNWNRQNVTVGYSVLLNDIAPPKKLPELIFLSEHLTRNFCYCRMDWLVSFDDKIYFSEFTFTPCAGRMMFHPISFDYKFGSLWIPTISEGD